MTWKRFFISIFIFAIPTCRPVLPENWLGTHNYLILAAIFGFILDQIDRKVNWGIPKEKLLKRQPLMKEILEGIQQNMVNGINNRGGNDKLTISDIRINVMIPVKNRFVIGWRKMKIFFHYGEYGGEELDTNWYRKKKGSGTCGEAWREKQLTIFDSKDSNYKRPKARLNSSQLSIAKLRRINSVLSVPILSAADDSKIVGVLNFDSEFNIDRTLFSDEEIAPIAFDGAANLSYLIPEACVKL